MKSTLKYRSIVILALLLLGACKKKPVVEIDEMFIGVWKHNINQTKAKYLIINSNSRGFIEEYENGEVKKFTQKRKWLTKKNTLYFGWTGSGNEKFSIDQSPHISLDTMIQSYDTVYPNQKFLILDGVYYKD